MSRYSGVAPAAWGLEVPGVVQTLGTAERVVALTFDACGGPRGSGYDAALTELTGVPPRFFQSGTAHYDDVAVPIAGDLGETVVNFHVNGDAGATFGPGQVASAVGSAGPGSIVIGHLNQPQGGTAEGVAGALPRLSGAGFRFVQLSEYLT